MGKTPSGRWAADKPAERELTETELRQANLRAWIGFPDNPFTYFKSPEDYPLVSMPATWPIEDMWMRIGRITLEHERLRKEGME